MGYVEQVSEEPHAPSSMYAYMNMQSTEVLRELFLPLGTDILEVLIAEDDYTALCDKQSKLIFLSI